MASRRSPVGYRGRTPLRRSAVGSRAENRLQSLVCPSCMSPYPRADGAPIPRAYGISCEKREVQVPGRCSQEFASLSPSLSVSIGFSRTGRKSLRESL